MTFGEQLKICRNKATFSQPELAELVGIEQSYLSKLENDKSIPSNEIFRSLLKAFDLSTGEFISLITSPTERQRLSQIPDVEHWLNHQQRDKLNRQRFFLYVSSALIVISATVFYIGFSKQLFNETRYE